MNKFGLVYNGAITENNEGAVTLEKVTYKNFDGVEIVANLYYPADFDENKKYRAVVVAHPNGGAKEQVSGLFAQTLAEAGVITIAFDAAYQGESGGAPRQTDKPQNRVEDIRASVDFLENVKEIDIKKPTKPRT